MSGYVIATGACICCRRLFSFNPVRVPSTSAITGKREPVCEACMHRINGQRAAMNLEPFEILDGAYEPCQEEEL
jgi:hypothetical protein